MKALNKGDVVRVIEGKAKGHTGVINRIDSESGMVSVLVTQHNGFAIWFQSKELKKIGRVK